jgi:predicted house-cleaning noncanonical NTP pyrophosphatase (MazG superfamily)
MGCDDPAGIVGGDGKQDRSQAMNVSKWTRKKHHPEKLFAKLIEEVGEVAKAKNEQTLAELDMELSHVIFIAEVMRWGLAEARGGKGTSLPIPDIRYDYDSPWRS